MTAARRLTAYMAAFNKSCVYRSAYH